MERPPRLRWAKWPRAVISLSRADSSPSRASGRSTSERIIGRFAGDGDVVHVAFAQAGGGDFHEARLLAQFLQVAGADIAHGRAQAADELVQDVRHGALE